METAVTQGFSKKIYKKDSKGKVRVLHVYTEGADLVQESGLLDGNLVTHRSTCKAKNVGKANETTPEQQAISEASSKIETKMSTGYFNTIEEAEEKGGAAVMLPMLAKSYDKESKKIDWNRPIFIQPKLDGMRCLAILKGGSVELLSRKGKVIDTVPHIHQMLLALANDRLDPEETVVFDGELYAHGKTFQENMRLIKKYRRDETESVVYHVYDTVLDEPFSKRFAALTGYVHHLRNNFTILSSAIALVETAPLIEESQVRMFHSSFVGQGYEGSIIRHGSEGYAVNKRSSNLLKFKDFIDEAYTITDVVPSEKRPEQGVIVCEGPSGTFHANMKMSHAERERILNEKDKYIGQTAEIRFFEYTDDGLPRFPVCVGFRLDK